WSACRDRWRSRPWKGRRGRRRGRDRSRRGSTGHDPAAHVFRRGRPGEDLDQLEGELLRGAGPARGDDVPVDDDAVLGVFLDAALEALLGGREGGDLLVGDDAGVGEHERGGADGGDGDAVLAVL